MLNKAQLEGIAQLVLAVLGPLAVAHHWATSDQLGAIAADLINLVFDISPVVAAIWMIIRRQHSVLIQHAANAPGVLKVVMDTQAGADALSTSGKPDNIVGPSEDKP
jgi:hypothetical protein